jgi:hypothetical protein
MVEPPLPRGVRVPAVRLRATRWLGKSRLWMVINGVKNEDGVNMMFNMKITW